MPQKYFIQLLEQRYLIHLIIPVNKKHFAKHFRICFLDCLIEITLRHGCSPINLLHIFRTPFYKKTSGGLLLEFKTTTVGRHFLHKNEFHTFLSAIISLT